MKKILLIPSIVLIVCCITVGAFNLVSGDNNRPLTFYESLVELANIEFSFDDMGELLNSISDAWSEEVSTYSSGGSLGGRFPSPEDTAFGGKDYTADTDQEWLNVMLNGISDFIYTIFTLIQILILVVKDSISTISTLFDLAVKFFVGVPQ